MAGERMTRMRLAPAVAVLGVTATLAACESDAPAKPSQELSQASPSTFACDMAKYILNEDRPDYLMVHLTNQNGRSVRGDTMDVRVLDTQVNKRLTLRDNSAKIELPPATVQVAVSVTKDGESHACPTVYYPFKQLDELK